MLHIFVFGKKFMQEYYHRHRLKNSGRLRYERLYGCFKQFSWDDQRRGKFCEKMDRVNRTEYKLH